MRYLIGLALVGVLGVGTYAAIDPCCDDHPTTATCTGADPCKACKNCSSCKHCKTKGNSCGVCKSKKHAE